MCCAEKFKTEHPEVNINLVVENTRRCCQAVARGDLDFAVVGGKVPSDLLHILLVQNLLCHDAEFLCIDSRSPLSLAKHCVTQRQMYVLSGLFSADSSLFVRQYPCLQLSQIGCDSKVISK